MIPTLFGPATDGRIAYWLGVKADDLSETLGLGGGGGLYEVPGDDVTGGVFADDTRDRALLPTGLRTVGIVAAALAMPVIVEKVFR